MRNVLAIAQREMKSSFVTPLAYVIIAGFLLLSGFFFFSLLQQFNTVVYQSAMVPGMKPNLNEWVVTPYYQTLEIIVLFLVPILTMRALAEERRSGTFELLITSPVEVSEIVLGKFFGIGIVVFIMLILSFIFPFVLVLFTEPEVLPVYVGFIGVLMFALAFTALGIAVSAFTKSQTVAGVVSLVSMLLIYVIDAPAAKFGEIGETVLTYLAPSNHTEPLLRGVIDGSDIVYFLSVISIGLFIANRALDAGRWR